MMKIAILQEFLPHYRKVFFEKMSKAVDLLDVFTIETSSQGKKRGLHSDIAGVINIKSINIKGIKVYSPFHFVNNKYDIIVLMLMFQHLTTWLLLLTKWIHKKRIILWGQGISVKRYMTEEIKPDWKLKLMIWLSDGVWFYMEKERLMWQKLFPNKPMISLNNTIDVTDILNVDLSTKKEKLKQKHKIKQDTILIFCARFENKYRRTDLLIDTIENLDSTKFGFIIIGAGSLKPDFSHYKNVYDYGAIYDSEIKNELFTIADIYYQPGWVGLSIVEAMAYGLPIFTFKRTEDVKQCVEFDYIKNGYNGMIFKTVEDLIGYLSPLPAIEVKTIGKNAKNFAVSNLGIDKMADNALSLLNSVVKKR